MWFAFILADLIRMEATMLAAIFTKVKRVCRCNFTAILIKMIMWYEPSKTASIKLPCPTETSGYHCISFLD